MILEVYTEWKCTVTYNNVDTFALFPYEKITRVLITFKDKTDLTIELDNKKHHLSVFDDDWRI